jgi:hypothetical protein
MKLMTYDAGCKIIDQKKNNNNNNYYHYKNVNADQTIYQLKIF